MASILYGFEAQFSTGYLTMNFGDRPFQLGYGDVKWRAENG